VSKFLLLAFLLIPFGRLVAQEAPGEQAFPILDFSGGLHSNRASIGIEDNEVQDALNVWFDEDFGVQKRKGFTIYGTTQTFQFSGAWAYWTKTTTTGSL